MKNQVTRTWVRQVRDLSYDTEDCIEFVLHLDTKQLFWLRLVRSNMVQTLLPLDQAVAEIKQLKARAEEVNQRNLRYNLIGNSGEQEQQKSAASQSSMDIFIKPRDAFDKHSGFSDLTRFLATEEQALQVVSVCGTGGDLGTISIIKKAYDHQDICQKFDCRAWVKLMNPFNLQEFIRCLLAGFFANVSPQEQGAYVGVNMLASMKTTQDSILVDSMMRLRKNTYLIVIDDVSSVVEWNAIREESIARHCAMSEDAMYNVQGLEVSAALRLFEKEAKSHIEPSRWDSNIVEEARLLINKCGRLPKLIVALGEYLANVPNGNGIWEAQRLNANFMYALKTRKGLDSFGDVLTWMYSTFQDFPQVLKKCIFYLSIFTQSTTIRRSRLVRRWIAEGYSVGTDSNSMVEYTEKLIHELATLGMMEHSPQTATVAGDKTSCQINSLFLDYIISRETEENIFLPLEVFVLRGESSLNTQRAGQHLAIASSWKRDKFVFDSLDFSQLRSLTVSREWRTFFVSDRMRVLRVLDLEETNVKDEDIEQI
nr:unnamed protein product [Digitaria exilis]